MVPVSVILSDSPTRVRILGRHFHGSPVKVKEADLYSAFIEVPYTQGAQVRITTVLPANYTVPASTSPDGASQTEVADI